MPYLIQQRFKVFMKKYVVGVDVGGTNIKLGLVHPRGVVIARSHFPTKPFSSSKKKLIGVLAHEIEKIITSQGLKDKDIAGVGVGVPGLVDFDKGVVRFLPNIPGWKNVPLKAILEKKLKLPVYVDNDVKLITLAEWKFGAGCGVKNLICLTLGTGVGSGLILDNRLYRGSANAAGELGHMPLNEKGPACNCGGFGCFEKYVGNQSLFALADQVMKKSDMTTQKMFALANAGNLKALQFWREAATHMGNGLVGVVNLLNPQLIVIGGGVSNNEKYLFPTIKEVIKKRSMSLQGSMVKIKRAKFGDDAGIIGAQVLVDNA
ncbi:MAG: ROK family protein [Candidatus Omnitrophica bacterium]|nr:ROK family protein [Candidatus Omnitrophota bacterium]